jgi:hypothetical protein
VKVSAHSSFLKKLRDTYGKQNVWVSDWLLWSSEPNPARWQ